MAYIPKASFINHLIGGLMFEDPKRQRGFKVSSNRDTPERQDIPEA